MFGTRFHIMNLFGFPVYVDLSWFIIVALITWSLAVGVFPAFIPGLQVAAYWWMGLAGALGLFVSIVLHELGHSLVARKYGIPMRGITLFIFGGVAEMSSEPDSPKVEFLVAIAGPVVSVVLAVALYWAGVAGAMVGAPAQVTGVLLYLGLINGVLVAFNIVPAFPLDGGRVLRSALWQWRGSLKWATRVTSSIGSGFGVVLILLGVYSVFLGNLIAGLWWFLIGLFLRSAAQMSYQQLLVRRALVGEPVSRFMQPHVQTVSPQVSLQELVDRYVLQYHYKMFPVVDEDRLRGCVSVQDVKTIPREEWPMHQVDEIVHACSEDNSISPNADALEAIEQMNRTGASRLMVVERGALLGIVSIRDLMRFISLKVELEDGAPAARRHEASELMEEDFAETADRR